MFLTTLATMYRREKNLDIRKPFCRLLVSGNLEVVTAGRQIEIDIMMMCLGSETEKVLVIRGMKKETVSLTVNWTSYGNITKTG